MSLMGKTSVHEIYPNQIEETATLITLYIFRFASLNYLQWLFSDKEFRKAKMDKYLEEKFPREQYRVHIGSIRSFDPSTISTAYDDPSAVEDDDEEEEEEKLSIPKVGSLSIETLPIDDSTIQLQMTPTTIEGSTIINEVSLTPSERLKFEKLYKKLNAFSKCILKFGIKYGRVLVGVKHGLKHEKHIHACSIW
eukprot:CAMPEP_0117421794 /NCGR_PEP_ID=MMETSP0758-20121206/2778_1 /TAXON_ID=63605 /ORGANISM="Percolomonas cosmopolitus, Strain AE-1 (ATCC 50343)" /LENGTH=193 /DNA_ID=CAMNT_0005204059 /DNA_START=1164 /DNA_END=1742 /DNA_ORIENTATION=+